MKELMDQSKMPCSPSEEADWLEDSEGNAVSYPGFVATLFKPYADLENRLDHAIIGLAGEAGEVCDEVKQLTIYEKELNQDKLKVELGDCLFYIQAMCNEFGWTLYDLQQRNLAKLEERYHKKVFSNDQALERADGEAK